MLAAGVIAAALALAPAALGVTLIDGDIVVNDSGTSRLLQIDGGGDATEFATIASFPVRGIAVETDGSVLVAGRGAGGGPGDFAKVIRVDPDGGATQVLTSGGLLSVPVDVDVAADGAIYAVDEGGTGRVIRIDPASGAQTLIASGPPVQAIGTLAAPRGIAVAGDGNLLVANRNTLDPGVLRFAATPGATPATVASGEPPFELPHGIDVEDDGRIVVADPFVAPLFPGAQTGALIRVDPATGGTNTVMSGFAPLGIAVEPDGTLAVVSSGNAGVWEVDPATGARTSLTGGITPTAIEVADVNRPPVADDDVYPVEADGSLTVPAVGVLANDDDPDNDPLTTVLADAPGTGDLDLSADGGFTYTPPAGFLGDVTFTYAASDGLAESNTATVTLRVRDTTAPTVTVEKATGQADPASQSPVAFAIRFSEPVLDLAAGDVALGGSATAQVAELTGAGADYDLLVDVTSPGTVTASLPAGAAQDAAGNASAASTSDDNEVTFVPATAAAVSVADAVPVEEGDTGTKAMRFTISRTGPTTQRARIVWHTEDIPEDGEAEGGVDYETRTAQTANIPIGATSATVTVRVIGDRVDEGDEALRVVLDSSTGAPISGGVATGRSSTTTHRPCRSPTSTSPRATPAPRR
ncbi:MAG: Ig-like domain-containing protein [Acidimicrobiia bacterium]